MCVKAATPPLTGAPSLTESSAATSRSTDSVATRYCIGEPHRRRGDGQGRDDLAAVVLDRDGDARYLGLVLAQALGVPQSTIRRSSSLSTSGSVIVSGV